MINNALTAFMLGILISVMFFPEGVGSIAAKIHQGYIMEMLK